GHSTTGGHPVEGGGAEHWFPTRPTGLGSGDQGYGCASISGAWDAHAGIGSPCACLDRLWPPQRLPRVQPERLGYCGGGPDPEGGRGGDHRHRRVPVHCGDPQRADIQWPIASAATSRARKGRCG
ncbi:unnamed protein product, partial [Heterosigma akashiwo]